jgi:hypothetical protein
VGRLPMGFHTKMARLTAASYTAIYRVPGRQYRLENWRCEFTPEVLAPGERLRLAISLAR